MDVSTHLKIVGFNCKFSRCALLAFSGHGDAKVGSAVGVALFLGVWLGMHGSIAVQGNIVDVIESLDKACDFDWDGVNELCKLQTGLIMKLCAVIFGSIGCFIAVAALATTLSVAKTVVEAI